MKNITLYAKQFFPNLFFNKYICNHSNTRDLLDTIYVPMATQASKILHIMASVKELETLTKSWEQILLGRKRGR